MFFVNWRFSLIALAYAPLQLLLFSVQQNIKSSAQAAREKKARCWRATRSARSAW
jgi:hypothetical protein